MGYDIPENHHQDRPLPGPVSKRESKYSDIDRRRAQGKIVDQVFQERRNQDALKEKGKFQYTCADQEITHMGCMIVLTEEVGEVARAILNRGELSHDYTDATKHLRKELIQVMAVAMAWVEKIDKEGGNRV